MFCFSFRHYQHWLSFGARVPRGVGGNGGQYRLAVLQPCHVCTAASRTRCALWQAQGTQLQRRHLPGRQSVVLCRRQLYGSSLQSLSSLFSSSSLSLPPPPPLPPPPLPLPISPLFILLFILPLFLTLLLVLFPLFLLPFLLPPLSSSPSFLLVLLHLFLPPYPRLPPPCLRTSPLPHPPPRTTEGELTEKVEIKTRKRLCGYVRTCTPVFKARTFNFVSSVFSTEVTLIYASAVSLLVLWAQSATKGYIRAICVHSTPLRGYEEKEQEQNKSEVQL